MGTHSRAAKQAVVEETSEEANWRGSSQFWREKLKYADNWSSLNKKTSEELRMLSRSLSDCKSLTLNAMIQVPQFVRKNQIIH